MAGPVQAQIQEKLTAAFAPIHLEVENESSRHAVPAGSETHFKVLVVSAKFEGLSRVARQRLVNEALKAELTTGVHALAQKTMTPAEWQASTSDFQSPPCMGASKTTKD